MRSTNATCPCRQHPAIVVSAAQSTTVEAREGRLRGAIPGGRARPTDPTRDKRADPSRLRRPVPGCGRRCLRPVGVRPQSDSKYCVDIKNATPGDRAEIHTWDCDGGKRGALAAAVRAASGARLGRRGPLIYEGSSRRSRVLLRLVRTIHSTSGSIEDRSSSKRGRPAPGSAAIATLQQ